MGLLGYEPLDTQLDEECGSAVSSRQGSSDAVIASVTLGSPAALAGLREGDRLLSINDEPIHDAIDFMFQSSEEEVDVRFEREISQGRIKTFRANIHRSEGEELGIVLRDFKIKMCNNQCVFCFIHQNPPGLRKGIYFKDGDFRMSFLHGNYITTTNMKRPDFDRIIEQRLSPMYVSVHTTNPELRLRMLGVKRSSNVLENLEYLKKGGIQFHTQIVLCPGWNDGAELDRTIRELSRLRPALLSIAIVPLGMTDYREGLPKMTAVTPSFCKRVIEQVAPAQEKLRKKCAEPILFLADEFYITANLPAPKYDDSEIMHQLENGVGMVWDFMLPWRSVARSLPKSLQRPRSVAILTGLLGARVLRPVVERLSNIRNFKLDVIPCSNSLFGKSITVSGLLSGGDFKRAVAENPTYDRYLIPGNSVRAEGRVFLDDMPLEELEKFSRGRLQAIEGNVSELVAAALA